ncbi:uncharacterized protein LOC130891850 [Diorhabda carinulata]|uniref:uncharacterized protein LOC130891850 n=1 Tax=Diorhabda carinulata TaxID=1163345 RepID=UPI0025A01C03|nr:uncharacterized protein LOC130891850 [Diorhabda carinulata]
MNFPTIILLCFTIAASHPSDVLEKLIELHNADTDTLRKDTQTLIETTETEMTLLRNLAESNILKSVENINKNVDIILAYSVARTNNLSIHLADKVDKTSAKYPEQAKTTCLTLIEYLVGLPGSFQPRIELSLATAVRIGNSTVREDINLMDNKFLLLNALSQSLIACGDDYDCVVKISEEAVEYNTEFINSFNDILVNINKVPKQIINQAIRDVENTVYINEDYACNNADIMLTCLTSFDDETDDDTSTTTSTPWLTTTTRTTTTTRPSSTTTSVNTELYDDNQPDPYCNHPPFNPSIDV